MNRRKFLTAMGPASISIVGMMSGVTVQAFHLPDKKSRHVVVFDRCRVPVEQAMNFAQSLGLAEGTMLIPVYCRDGQHPDDAFAVLEAKE